LLTHPKRLALACLLVLTGCSASHTSPPQSDPPTTAVVAEQVTTPTSSAKMVCAKETSQNIATSVGLKRNPTPSATWADHTYTCTYQLPFGRLVLAVEQSPTQAAAQAYLDVARTKFHATTSLSSTSNSAYASTTGTVLLMKDRYVLHVDATALPAVLGTSKMKRTDFAEVLASDILECWNGD
jgi:hypothetical protein